MIGGRPIAEEVFINGQGPFKFLVDTGSQTNQIDAAIAQKLALIPTFRVEMATSNGAALVPGSRVQEVSLGDAIATQQEFMFTSLESIRTVSPNIQGVLGQEFLAHFDYLLDLANHRMIFNPGVPDGGIRSTFAMENGRPAVDTSEGRLVLDSGTDTSVLFRNASTAIAPPMAAAGLLTNTGSSSVSVLQNLRIKIAGREYRIARAAVLPKSPANETGLLPTGLFHAVYFCNSGNYVVFDPTSRADKLPN